MTPNSDSKPAIAAMRSRRLLRITLWRFFVAITLGTLVVSLINTVRLSSLAERRLERLHAHFGIARVGDSAQPAVRASQLPNDKQYRFHITQPTGRRFRLCLAFSDINFLRPNFPAPQWNITTPEVDEFWLNMDLTSPGTQHTVTLTLSSPVDREPIIIPVPADLFLNQMLDGKVGTTIRAMGGGSDLPERWRSGQTPLMIYAWGERIWMWSSPDPPASEGIMLWLEEVPSATNISTN